MATETRRYRIQGKRFARRDVYALAELFATIANGLGNNARLSFELSTMDGVVYESEDLRHIEEGSAIDLKNIFGVSLEMRHFGTSSYVDLDLTHGHSYGSLRVSGSEETWVHAVFSRLRDRLQSIEPSDSWFTRHPVPLFGAAAVVCIFMLVLGLVAIFAAIFRLTPLTASQVFGHGTAGATGTILGVASVRGGLDIEMGALRLAVNRPKPGATER